MALEATVAVLVDMEDTEVDTEEVTEEAGDVRVDGDVEVSEHHHDLHSWIKIDGNQLLFDQLDNLSLLDIENIIFVMEKNNLVCKY